MLVDELAHTNVPGTAHEKRWQSVEELLAAGIDVLTTVNVQHLESLNDAVFQITGVRVQETVPDSVVDRAEEIVLVDLTTPALLNRLRRGVIYDLDKIPGALQHFFTRGNLLALRELALRKTSEEVDDFLEKLPRRAAQDRASLGHRRSHRRLHSPRRAGQEAGAPRLSTGQALSGALLDAAREDARSGHQRRTSRDRSASSS